MKKQVFNMKVTEDNIYVKLLAFLNFSLEATPQEREVLAALIKLNHEYEALPADRRAKFILSTDMRKEVREFLDIEEKQFNTIISRLRKKKFMGVPVFDKNDIINDLLLIKPDEDGLLIGFSMKLEKATKEEKKEEPIIEESEEKPELIVPSEAVEEKKTETAPAKELTDIEKRMRQTSIQSGFVQSNELS